MIKFNLPNKLNGTQLKKELNDAGVIITESPLVDNFLWLIIEEKDEAKARVIVNNHIGIDTPPVELTVEQKLASVGLSLEDLKAALDLTT